MKIAPWLITLIAIYIFGWRAVTTALPWVALGTVLYLLDLHLFTRIGKRMHDFVSEHPMAQEFVRGYISHRSFAWRLGVAMGIAFSFGAFPYVLFGWNTVKGEFFSLFYEIPSVLLGFFLAPAVNALLGRRSEFFSAVERLESGDINLEEHMSSFTYRWWTKVRHLFKEPYIMIRRTPPASSLTQDGAALHKEQLPPQPKVDPRDIIERYTKGGT
ncbi:MAG: hypothetical protein Q8R40_03690 [bacterium]|nr:hypothetical protein [bacterium]